jgi:DNA-binding CsgD family transcriptional regulator
MVDLRGQLSNPSPALVRLADQDIGTLPTAPPKPVSRTRLGSARRLRPDEVEAVATGYRAGKTMKELAAEFGISRQTVSTHLRRAGAPIRREGVAQEQAVEVVSLYEAGRTSRDIAGRYGVSADTVLRTLRRRGVEIRSRHATIPR